MEQVRSNKDASKKFLFKKMVLKFCFKIFLQDIAVKEQCLNFSNDSMLFLINFRDLKKKRITDGPTDLHIEFMITDSNPKVIL